MDKKKKKRSTRRQRKKSKTMHFDHSCIAFLCLLSVQGNWFYGIHNLQWRWTLKRTLEWYWGCCQEKSERLYSDIFILFSPLPLFLHHSFFSCPWGQNANSLRGVFGILLASVTLLCYRSWILSIYSNGVHCAFDLHGRSDFMLVCVCVCIP